jgi:dephospho-CoA kinase
MKRIAIAGGIGSGKTAVTDYLAGKGFSIIDADIVARRVVERGSSAWIALRDAFGDAVLNDLGGIDRAFLASIAFSNPSALARLNSITHRAIGREIARELDVLDPGIAVAFIALPLFRTEHRRLFAIDEVWAVLASRETAISRLVTMRGFTETEAEKRIDAQISNSERESLADRTIWNEASLQELYRRIDEILVSENLL